MSNVACESEGFVRVSQVAPTVIQTIRYGSELNFLGRAVNGYETKQDTFVSVEAGSALAAVAKDAESMGFHVILYDAYRPQRAVDDFMRWCDDTSPDGLCNKELYYPAIDKQSIVPDGFIAEKSGHSRGSAVDVSLLPIGKNLLTPYRVTSREYVHRETGKTMTRKFIDDNTLDMGSHFDLFDPLSFFESPWLDTQHIENRSLLQLLMKRHGFEPYDQEWWHFSFRPEPFPDQYFDFPITSSTP